MTLIRTLDIPTSTKIESKLEKQEIEEEFFETEGEEFKDVCKKTLHWLLI